MSGESDERIQVERGDDLQVVIAEGDDEGERARAIERAIEGFAAACGLDQVSSLLVERFDASESFEPALLAASTPSLTGEPKAIVVECRSISEARAEEICGWLAKARSSGHHPGAVLVAISSERKLTAGVRKKLEGCNVRFEAPERPSHQELPAFVAALAGDFGLELTPEAAAFLGAAVGADVHAIRSALAQLADAYPLKVSERAVAGAERPDERSGRPDTRGERAVAGAERPDNRGGPSDKRSGRTAPRIGIGEVQAIFEPARHDPPWVLMSAIERGDAADAISSLEGFLDGGYHPLQVLAMLYTSCRRIAYLASAEGAHKEILASLNLAPGAKARISKLARRLGPARARLLVQRIADADLDLKGRSGLDSRAVIEKLVIGLCEICR